jgi:predicted enzyme related to lactoylglutathione lyase
VGETKCRLAQKNEVGSPDFSRVSGFDQVRLAIVRRLSSPLPATGPGRFTVGSTSIEDDNPYERSTWRVGKRHDAGVTMEVLFASMPSADLHAAMGWYERLFGRPADIVPNDDEVMWCVAGNGWLYVIEDSERAGRTVVTISVSDLDQFVADLASRGISAGPIEAVGDAGRKANVVDADGNVISWIQVAAGS